MYATGLVPTRDEKPHSRSSATADALEWGSREEISVEWRVTWVSRPKAPHLPRCAGQIWAAGYVGHQPDGTRGHQWMPTPR